MFVSKEASVVLKLESGNIISEGVGGDGRNTMITGGRDATVPILQDVDLPAT